VFLGLAACSERPRPPDVILISLDSVRADALTFLDEESTPVLAALAKRGTVFTRAVSGSSWTLPAHAQMFTGQPPLLHGVQDDERKIDPLTSTLPECLAERGFATAGFWSGWFLAGPYGFKRGFDRYESALQHELSPEAGVDDAQTADEEARRTQFIQRENSSHRQITSERILELATDALEQVDASEPLFLFTHFFDPHYDYVPPAPFDTRFDEDYAGDIDGRDFWANRRIFDASKQPARQINERDLDHVRALYRGELAWTDQVIGKLLEQLQAHGRLDNALIIVTADHGEEFFEHGNRGHRQGLYEEVLRVPLLIVRPSSVVYESPAVPTASALVSLSDLMPTILETVGGSMPASIWGRSLLPHVEGRVPAADQERLVVSTLTTRIGDETKVMDALHTGADKFIRQVNIPIGGPPTVESLLWFDLVRDRGEQSPRVRISRPEVAAAWGRLEREMERLRAFHDTLPHSAAEDRQTDVREIFASELEQLGYAGDADDVVPDSEAVWTLQPMPALRPPMGDE
jgi:arylsulfatase A-like enzyme